MNFVQRLLTLGVQKLTRQRNSKYPQLGRTQILFLYYEIHSPSLCENTQVCYCDSKVRNVENLDVMS